jgi:hypothetical protein
MHFQRIAQLPDVSIPEFALLAFVPFRGKLWPNLGLSKFEEILSKRNNLARVGIEPRTFGYAGLE